MAFRWRPETAPATRPSGAEAGIGALSRDELAALLAAARSVNSDAGAPLHSVLAAAVDLLGGDEGSVAVFDPDRERLEVVAAWGAPARVPAPASTDGIAGRVAASGRPLLARNAAEVARYGSPGRRSRRLRAVVSVPLRSDGRVEGVLSVGVLDTNRVHPGLDERAVNLVGLFAEHAAAALERHLALVSTRRRGDDLARLYEIGHALATATSVERWSTLVLDAASELLDARDGFVCVRPADGPPEATAYRGVTRGRVMAVVRRPAFLQLAAGCGVRVVAELSSDPALLPLLGPGTGRPAVVVPLDAGDEGSGVLVAVPDGPPGEAALRLAGMYAHQASVALGRALAFRRMRAREAELAALVHAFPDPVLVVDRNARLLAMNPVAAERLALNPQFDVGTQVAGKLRSPALDALLAAEHGGQEEVVLLTPAPRTYLARVKPAGSEPGLVGARVVVLRDVTAEREIVRRQADFVAVIGHELRTPLTLIKGYAATLVRREDELSRDVRRRAVEAVAFHAVRLERLVEDLLLVAGIERGRPALSCAEHDLVELLRRVVATCAGEHPDRRITLTTDCPSLVVALDAVKVEQVLRHLLDNALKFSQAPAPVEVRLETSADEVAVAVRDEGMGIFSGDLPRLFDRFQQADGTTTRAHGGTGIGLHIARTLTEAHGGRIDVASALGRGSTFTVVLPRRAEARPEAAQPSRFARPDVAS